MISANLISIGSQVSTKDQLLLPRMRYGNAYNMSAIAIHKHKVSQLNTAIRFDLRKEFDHGAFAKHDKLRI